MFWGGRGARLGDIKGYVLSVFLRCFGVVEGVQTMSVCLCILVLFLVFLGCFWGIPIMC